MTSPAFYSDVKSGDEVGGDLKVGSAITDGSHVYVPTAWGHQKENRIDLYAGVERYTRVLINGRTVLMRDDALKQYRDHNRLYDYGILIKVSDGNEWILMDEAEQESIKVLYQNPAKEWKDPFVHGPNER